MKNCFAYNVKEEVGAQGIADPPLKPSSRGFDFLDCVFVKCRADEGDCVFV